uniref:DNA-directed RNA polymerase subunit n=1 Tax=Spumella sp. NIES-1846 TaxID=2490549 RepID=A0A455RGT7_9STRA|nr:RNA polymerase b'-subunit [Spumella sp. NIES-1846]
MKLNKTKLYFLINKLFIIRKLTTIYIFQHNWYFNLFNSYFLTLYNNIPLYHYLTKYYKIKSFIQFNKYKFNSIKKIKSTFFLKSEYNLKNLSFLYNNLYTDIDYVQIYLASPLKIKLWAIRYTKNLIIGEIKTPQILDIITQTPSLFGLFCPKIFGPLENYKCLCKSYTGYKKNSICDFCGTELNYTLQRRFRMGFIDLTYPAIHSWYLYGNPNYLRMFLTCIDPTLTNYKLFLIVENLTYLNIKKLALQNNNVNIYFLTYSNFYLTNIKSLYKKYKEFFINKNDSKSYLLNLIKDMILTFKNITKTSIKINQTFFSVEQEKNIKTKIRFLKFGKLTNIEGNESILSGLDNLNLLFEIFKKRNFYEKNVPYAIEYIPAKELLRTIRIFESFYSNNISPKWMLFTALPVLPPAIRPYLDQTSNENEDESDSTKKNNTITYTEYNLYYQKILENSLYLKNNVENFKSLSLDMFSLEIETNPLNLYYSIILKKKKSKINSEEIILTNLEIENFTKIYENSQYDIYLNLLLGSQTYRNLLIFFSKLYISKNHIINYLKHYFKISYIYSDQNIKLITDFITNLQMFSFTQSLNIENVNSKSETIFQHNIKKNEISKKKLLTYFSFQKLSNPKLINYYINSYDNIQLTLPLNKNISQFYFNNTTLNILNNKINNELKIFLIHQKLNFIHYNFTKNDLFNDFFPDFKYLDENDILQVEKFKLLNYLHNDDLIEKNEEQTIRILYQTLDNVNLIENIENNIDNYNSSIIKIFKLLEQELNFKNIKFNELIQNLYKNIELIYPILRLSSYIDNPESIINFRMGSVKKFLEKKLKKNIQKQIFTNVVSLIKIQNEVQTLIHELFINFQYIKIKDLYYAEKCYLSWFKNYVPHIESIQTAKYSLQKYVEALIDNARLHVIEGIDDTLQPTQCLTGFLEGKAGKFRNLVLGKRIDYSGRSVITVGPNLGFNDCGIPYKILITIFKPLLYFYFSKSIDFTLNKNYIIIDFLCKQSNLLFKIHTITLKEILYYNKPFSNIFFNKILKNYTKEKIKILKKLYTYKIYKKYNYLKKKCYLINNEFLIQKNLKITFLFFTFFNYQILNIYNILILFKKMFVPIYKKSKKQKQKEKLLFKLILTFAKKNKFLIISAIPNLPDELQSISIKKPEPNYNENLFQFLYNRHIRLIYKYQSFKYVLGVLKYIKTYDMFDNPLKKNLDLLDITLNELNKNLKFTNHFTFLRFNINNKFKLEQSDYFKFINNTNEFNILSSFKDFKIYKSYLFYSLKDILFEFKSLFHISEKEYLNIISIHSKFLYFKYHYTIFFTYLFYKMFEYLKILTSFKICTNILNIKTSSFLIPQNINNITWELTNSNNFTNFFNTFTNILHTQNSIVLNLLQKHILQYSTVILNRAPTLHRYNIQAFQPKLTLTKTIILNPLVCSGFNADFDGDQMALYLPCYNLSQKEINLLMKPLYNIISISSNKLVYRPTQEMIMGCYYLTLIIKDFPNIIKNWFNSESLALLAYMQKRISLYTPILIKYTKKNYNILYNNKNFELLILYKNIILSKTIFLIKKIYKLGEIYPKYILLTNIGIIIINFKSLNIFKITDFFLETTVGHIIFNLNYFNSL